MFLKGECADFPDSWSDRMWGPDDLPNQRTQYELRRAAVRICEACPVRAECLAFGIMVRDQYGIYGGLPLRARRQVLKTAPHTPRPCRTPSSEDNPIQITGPAP